MPISRALFQQQAQKIMRIAGDIPDMVTYRKLAYDATGQPTGGYAATVTGLRALAMKIDLSKVDNSAILLNDRMYLIAGADLLGVVPEEDDTLDLGAAGVWTIKSVQPDPARATYELLVRL